MIKTFEFTKGNWEEYFEHAFTEKFPFTPKFIQEKDCISSGKNPEMKDGFDYTTIMTKEKYGKGTKLWTTCLFEDYGAPLITLTDTLERDSNGNLTYAACKEVVLWEEGINVWSLFVEDGEIKWHLIAAAKFPVEKNVKHELYVEIKEKYIRAVVGKEDIEVRIEDLPEEVYIGITGCENINKFYDLKIEN